MMDNLSELVVKEVNGRAATGCSSAPMPASARSTTSQEAAPRAGRFIAQPTLSLSTCPTFVASGIAPRHVDLRPFVLCGRTRSESCPAV